jgi:phosphoribulokinase
MGVNNMDFDYIIEGSIFISEDELNEMAEQVKRGTPVEVVVDSYIACLDDYEYFISDAFDYKIINEVRKRASLL